MKTSKGKRIFAWLMAALMALMFIIPSLSTMASADDGDEYYEEDVVEDDFSDEKNQISDLNNKFAQLQKQQQEISSKITQVKGEKEKQIAIKQQIDSQINNTIAQIDVLNDRIGLLEDQISEKKKEMDQKQKDIDANFELFKKRVRALCSTKKATTLGLILGADSFSQFLTRTEATTRISKYDTNMIKMLTDQRNELESIKKGIEQDKNSVQEDRNAQASKKDELSGQMVVAQNKIQDISAMEKEFMANKDALTKQMQQVQAEIAKIYAEINKTSMNTQYTGGKMGWPVPSLSQITCPFGWRFGGSDFHTGIDISGGGAYGATIVAANTGTVKVANTSFTPGYGYGKYIIIDHGGAIQTLYGHCSALNVSVGQVVAKGQPIAQVGSTGWSTGPHIHFEIRQNGKAVNPLGGGWLEKG